MIFSWELQGSAHVILDMFLEQFAASICSASIVTAWLLCLDMNISKLVKCET